MDNIWQALEQTGFKVSTDTRKEVRGTIFLALKGENFDGGEFVDLALEQGAVGAVTENTQYKDTPNVFVVESVLRALQELAHKYRKTFNIPIIAIGGSNGKTTTRELTAQVLDTKHKVHRAESSFNNHLGVPLTILSMPRDTEVGVFEVGANHPGEHTSLLDILEPTHVAVTNNGMDHLEGFGSIEGVESANAEILEWAQAHQAQIVSREDHGLQVTTPLPLTLVYDDKEFKTKLFGSYNAENIDLALTFCTQLGVDIDAGLSAITQYQPKGKRSEIVEKGDTTLIIDCYNANPTSMSLALQDFLSSAPKPRGVILGDMLELGSYEAEEHKKVAQTVLEADLDIRVFIGPRFKQALDTVSAQDKAHWFPDSPTAHTWFAQQSFPHHTFLLKGSRGIAVERIL